MQGKYKNKTYPLRIDENILSEVKAIAEQKDISANKQIENILRDYLERQDKKKRSKNILIARRYLSSKHANYLKAKYKKDNPTLLAAAPQFPKIPKEIKPNK